VENVVRLIEGRSRSKRLLALARLRRPLQLNPLIAFLRERDLFPTRHSIQSVCDESTELTG
jgi:hypothetical protein